MNKIILCFTLCLLTINSVAIEAQTIKGTVSDSFGTLPGVNIVVKGTKIGTISDINGNFSITPIQGKYQLQLSFTGYEVLTINAKGKTSLNVLMKESTKQLDELVVVGYGTMKKRDITGAIASVSAYDLTNNSPIDIGSALQGKVAGLDIISSSEPGANASFKIRGASTVSDEGSSPLFIVDGMEVENISNINPRDIASLEVLKDAASAAIYGSKSANGVVIITTQQGNSEKPRITVGYALKQSQISRKLPQMNRRQGIEYEELRAFLENRAVTTVVTDTLNPSYIYDNNYQDIMFRPAYTHQVDLSIAGRDKKLKYYISGAYLNDQGIQINTFNSRLSTRINTDYTASKVLTIGSRIALSVGNNMMAPWGSRSNILSRPASMAVQYPDGTYVPVIASRSNPYAWAMLCNNSNEYYDINAYEYAEFNILKGLKFKTSIAASFYQNNHRYFQPGILVQSFIPTSSNTHSTTFRWTQENVLSYNTTINKDHTLGALAGLSFQENKREGLALNVSGNISESIESSDAYTEVNIPKTRHLWTKNRMASLFGRLTYSYKGKYLLNSNIRYDGSSRFGRSNRWGIFPSISLGWRFSDESFMEWSKEILSDAKLRYSYGLTGNQSASDFAALSRYSVVAYGEYIGVAPTQLENNLLGWESTRQQNIGLDLSFLNGRVNMTLDYYIKNTKDILFDMKLPGTTGFDKSFTNLGGIDNKGFEINISGKILRSKDYEWSVGLNLATNKNTISSIPSDAIQIMNDVYILDNGYTLGTMYGYKAKQIFPYDQSNAFTPEWTQLTPIFDNKDRFVKYQLNGKDYTGEVKQLRHNTTLGEIYKGGDVMWDDKNNDGVIDANDRQVIGCGQADVMGGLSTDFRYKAFTFSAFFSFSLGGEVYNRYEASRSDHKWSTLTQANPVNVANSWKAPGDIAKYPQCSSARNAVDNTRPTSSLWIEDGSYIRLKNVKLDYKLPQTVLKPLHIQRASINVMLDNFFTWSNYSGFDPEVASAGFTVGYDNNSYPKTKSVVVGINVTF